MNNQPVTISHIANRRESGNMKHTEKYTRDVDSLKGKVVNSLPEIIL